MPTLNRFPLLGLWAREAARRIGYSTPDAEALGHAYAVLYAIRANKRPEPLKAAEAKPKSRRRTGVDELRFGGDTLDVIYDDAGHVQGLVGGCSGYIVSGNGTPGEQDGPCMPPPTTVPEPAGLGVFGLGVVLIGLFIGLRRRYV